MSVISLDQAEALEAEFQAKSDTIPLSQRRSITIDQAEAMNASALNIQSPNPEPTFENKVHSVLSQGDRSFFENIAESFKRNDEHGNFNLMAFESSLGRFKYDDKLRPIRFELDEVGKTDPIKGDNFLSDAIYAVSGMVPGIAAGAIRGSVAGAALASATALAGAPALAPLAFTVGQVGGSSDYWYRQGAGGLYSDLKEEDIDDAIAVPISHIGGAIYGAIEFSQATRLLPGSKLAVRGLITKSTKKLVANMVKRHGINWAQNVGEEGLQEIVKSISSDVAVQLADKMDFTSLQIVERAMNSGFRAVKDSALPLFLLMAPGMAIDTKRASNEQKAVKQAEEILASLKLSEKILAKTAEMQEAEEKAEAPAEKNVAAPALEAPAAAQAAPSLKQVSEMTIDELDALILKTKEEDKNLEVSLFGEEGAKKYARLQRQANSLNNPQAADKASEEVDRMEASLTEEQRNKLFGIGQEGVVDVDTLKQLRRAVGSVSGDTAQELGQSISTAITDVGGARDVSEMNSSQLAAFMEIKRAFELAREQGFDTKEVSDAAIMASASRFSDPEDAAFMLRRFAEKAEAPAEKNVAAPALEAPAAAQAEYTGEGDRQMAIESLIEDISSMEAKKKKIIVDPNLPAGEDTRIIIEGFVPEYLSNIGVTKARDIPMLEKASRGEKLTEKQAARVDELIQRWVEDQKAQFGEQGGVVEQEAEVPATAAAEEATPFDEPTAAEEATPFDEPTAADTAAEDAEVEKNRELQLVAREARLSRKVQEVITGAMDFSEDLLTPIADRLGRIHPRLRAKIKKFEADSHQLIFQDQGAVTPFLRAIAKMSKKDSIDFDLALKNGNRKVVDQIVGQYDMRAEFDARTKVLNGIRDRAHQVGFTFGELTDYHPRAVKDVVGFLKHIRDFVGWTQFDEAIRIKNKELGANMNDAETAAYINSFLRTNREDAIKLNRPGALKERTIKKLSAAVNQYYHDSSTALLRHIYTVNTAIAARKFFGRAGTGGAAMDNIDGSIGALVLDLFQKNEITGEQAVVLSEVLKARFNERGPRPFVGLVKRLALIDVLGSPMSAITQIQDIHLSLFKNGYYRTGKSILKQVTGQKTLSKEDVFLSTQAQEFSDSRDSAKLVERVFRANGFEFADNFGKAIFINSAYGRLQAEAKAGNKKFLEQLDMFFEGEAAAVVEDLKADKVSENVKLLLLSELMDFQPITLSQLPVAFNRGGDARVFYMLKTYTISQLAVYRREIIDKMGTEPLVALRNFASLTTALLLLKAGSDGIKDFILGRDFDLGDSVIEGLWIMLGFSRFMADQAAMKGPAKAFGESLVPPLRALDSIYLDFKDTFEKGFYPMEWRSIRSLPVGGDLFYWWVGGGRTKLDEAARKGKRPTAP